MVKAMHDELGITVPVALHLDHGYIRRMLQSASRLDSHPSCSTVPTIRSTRTLRRPKELVQVAHAMGMSIEAEVGSIGGEEDGVIGMGECADPDECKRDS